MHLLVPQPDLEVLGPKTVALLHKRHIVSATHYSIASTQMYELAREFIPKN
jgi:hypothetical protein